MPEDKGEHRGEHHNDRHRPRDKPAAAARTGRASARQLIAHALHHSQSRALKEADIATETKINLADKLALLDGPYLPGIVGYLNDYKVIVVKVQGEFVWHKHDETDDFFLVLEGHLTIQLRDRNIELDPGELFIVPRGVEHCPKADEETHVLLIEPRDTVNTGDAGGEKTAEPVEL